jgi:tetratricopeptide (TPR) repeat protein
VRLTAGQRIEVADVVALAPPGPMEPPPGPPLSVEPPPGPGPIAPPLSALEAGPLAPPSVEPPPAPIPVDIVARADELVGAGRAAEAAAELTAYLATAPADTTAGLAAFLLGRIARDRLGQPGRAAEAFTRVLAIGSPRAIQADALARRAEALAADGQAVAAQAAARDYLARYPAGPRRGAMAALAGP